MAELLPFSEMKQTKKKKTQNHIMMLNPLLLDKSKEIQDNYISLAENFFILDIHY